MLQTTRRQLRPVNLALLRAYSSTSAGASPSEPNSRPNFDTLCEDLSTRLFYGRLNSATRNIVFRPTRAKELLARKNPVVVDGKKLEPMTYRGPPGKADLTKLLDGVTSVEQLSNIKQIIKGYATYVPENLKPSHLVKYLRAATSLGAYNDAASVLLTGYEFKPVRNKTVMKEMLRIHSVWAGSPRVSLSNISRTKASLYHAWNKIPVKSQQNDLDSNLILLYGLTGLQQKTAKDSEKVYARVEEHLKSVLEQTSALLTAIPAEFDVEELIGTGSVVAYVIDLTLGSRALEALGKSQDATKCKEIASRLLEAQGLKGTEFVDAYIEQIEQGYRRVDVEQEPKQEQE